MFLANYSDGLTDVHLDEMIDDVQEERQDRLLPRHPPAAHLPPRRYRRRRHRCKAFRTSDQVRDLDQRRLLHLPPARSSTIMQARARSSCSSRSTG